MAGETIGGVIVHTTLVGCEPLWVADEQGYPAQEMLQRATGAGAAVLRTDELGTIEVISDGQTMWWDAEAD